MRGDTKLKHVKRLTPGDLILIQGQVAKVDRLTPSRGQVPRDGNRKVIITAYLEDETPTQAKMRLNDPIRIVTS